MHGPRKPGPRKPAAKHRPSGTVLGALLKFVFGWLVLLIVLPVAIPAVIVLWLVVTGTMAFVKVAFTPPKGGD